MKSIVTHLLIFVFAVHHCISQTYDYTFKDRKFEFLVSMAFDIGVRSYDRLRTPTQLNDASQVDINNLWGIDSGAVGNFSSTADHASDYLLYASALMPLSLSLGDLSNDDSLVNIAMMGLQGFFIQDGLIQTTKMIVGRPRPYIYDEGVSAIGRSLSRTDLKSFPSGHTGTATYLCFFTAKVYEDLYPDSKWKPFVWTGAAMLPALTAYLRYDAGKHFPTDLITAYAIGVTFGILVPEFYKNEKLSVGAGNRGVIINIKI